MVWGVQADTADQTPGMGGDPQQREHLLRAALAYAAHGWPVLPGSAWDGRAFVVPGALRRTNGLQPIMARNYATTRPEVLSAWWGVQSRHVPSVLLRSGQAFDVISMTRPGAERVVTSTTFRRAPGPVIFRPDQGRVFFLVRPTVPLGSDGDRLGGDGELLPAGSWIAAPPTRAQGVAVAWWVTPETVDWQPAAGQDVVNALARPGLRVAVGPQPEAP